MTDPHTPAAVAPPAPVDSALATLPWQQRFANLGPDFVAPIAPAPLPDPYWVGQSVALAQSLGLPLERSLTVGDGANDLPMLQSAGLGIAFRAKPTVQAAAHARVNHGDLTALLFAQGFRRAEFAAM